MKHNLERRKNMKGKKLMILAAAGLLGAVSLTGCGKKKSEPTPEPTPTPTPEPEKDPELADGVFSYVNSPAAEREKILGLLEKYAVDNKLTGLTLYNSGGYALYNPALKKGTNTYIPGYGWGNLGDGDITADLEGESNLEWKRYLHTYITDDPVYMNSMNDKGSVVSDLQGYTTASYWTTKMNQTKDGYDWVSQLATVERPIAVNKSEATGLATTFKFPVKVGEDLKYTTLSATYGAKYNNRQVKLEDYITPYKIYYTKAYGMVRGSENLSGTGSIKGTSSYYNGSAKGFDAEKWEKVGIKAFVDENDGKSYLQFTFNLPTTEFFAMTYLASGMFQPVPAEFIEDIGGGDFLEGVKTWGASNEAGTLSPVDHWLALGPYTLERWDEDDQIVFKRNPNFQDGARYKIQGVHINVLAGAKSNVELPLEEFLANKIHSCGIPYTKLEQFQDDERAAVTVGSSNFKLNLNTCTQDQWESLFGEKGTVTQTEKADYWTCEPAMSNKDFVSGISFAIDRQGLAKKIGRNAAYEYFSPTYLIDPENGIAYNDTKTHKDAVASLVEGTDGYGYSLELAKAAFKRAAEKLIEDSVYNEGDTITIQIVWQEEADRGEFHNPIAQNLMDAFNTDDNPLRLAVEFYAPQTWSDVYYKHMMVGQFDIGFGSISGNEYDPLSFLNVLSTNPAINHNFCLNWGVDTNAVTSAADGLVYDGKIWSFDGLFMAANEGVYAKQGQNSDVENDVKNIKGHRNDDGSFTVEADFLEKKIKNDKGEVIVSSYVSSLNLYAYYTKKQTSLDLPVLAEDAEKSPAEGEGMEEYVHYKFTYPADTIEKLNADPYFVNYFAPYGGLMFDVYYAKDVFGVQGNPACVGSIYHLDVFPDAGEDSSPLNWYVENDWLQ